MKRNWKPVIKSLIRTLTKHNFTISTVDNGDGPVAAPAESPKKWAVSEIAATDESNLLVKGPDGRLLWVFMVLGNEPAETVCDYTCNLALERAIDEFCDKWEGRSCPVIKD